MNRLIKNLHKLALLATFSFLIGQAPDFHLLQSIPLPETNSGSDWDCIAVNSIADIYLLDRETGHVARIAPTGVVINETGGIGNDDLSFSDPVDLMASNLDILVSDRMENQITWFDRKLQFISTDKHAEIFPVQLIADDLDIFYILSKEQGLIWRRNFNQWDTQEHIDLMQNEKSPDCIEDAAIKSNGNLGLLYCDGTVLEYNPLGRLVRTFPKMISNAKYLVKYKKSWLLVSEDGTIRLSKNGENQIGSLPVKDIIDVCVIKSQLYMLSPNGIHIFSE